MTVLSDGALSFEGARDFALVVKVMDTKSTYDTATMRVYLTDVNEVCIVL